MNLFEQQAYEFAGRHIGPDEKETSGMLSTIGVRSLDELIDRTIPASIRSKKPLNIPGPLSEHQYLTSLRQVAALNKVFKSYIGQGYYDTIVPSVILRNVFENPGWYTQYTPYQAEISQGRLESLLNFQTMVADLTGLPLANASLLDEATAAAEAMGMCKSIAGSEFRAKFFVDESCHPQTIAVVKTRANSMGIETVVGAIAEAPISSGRFFGALIQFPGTDGR